MAENTKIEWTDHTFNPWIGCAAVSPACDRCYAEAWAKRTGNSDLWQGYRRRTTPGYWHQPVRWQAKAVAEGRRFRVFCASLADVFDNKAAPVWREDLWRLIAATPNLDWLLLTKRPQNIAKMLPNDWGSGWRNVWLGTTVENQVEADRRIPHLLRVPAAVRFLSCEPLLGPVDLRRAWGGPSKIMGTNWLDFINWVICGGESVPGARPMAIEWARSLRDQCKTAGVAFFTKQMGGPRKPFPEIPTDLMVREFPRGDNG